MNTSSVFNQADLQNTRPPRQLYFELGTLLYGQGLFEKAKTQFTEALNVNEKSVEDWRLYKALYEINLKLHNSSEANENLLKFIASAPETETKEIIEQTTNSGLDMHPVLAENNANDELQLGGKKLQFSQPPEKAKKQLQEALEVARADQDELLVMQIILEVTELCLQIGETKEAARQLRQLPYTTQSEITKRRQLLWGLIRLEEEKANLDSKMSGLLSERKYSEAYSTINRLLEAEPANAELMFRKIEVMLKGNFNLEEAGKLLIEVKARTKIEFIKAKIKQHIELANQDGNTHYFIAQAFKFLNDDFSLNDALQQADLALSKEVFFEGCKHPRSWVYRLKAEIFLFQKRFAEAVNFYHLSGKEFYAEAAYMQSLEMFTNSYRIEKEHSVQPPLIENYRYYADCATVLSYTTQPPYVDETLIKRAKEVWSEGYLLQKPSANDAWSYLTASGIHEQLAKLPETDRHLEFLYSWLYAEHSILINDGNPKAWFFLSRALTSNALSYNASVAAETGYLLDKDDSLIWEEKVATLLNLGKWEEARTFLDKLLSISPDQTVYKAWQGFALYHQADYPGAKKIFDAVISRDESWMWARHLRLFINWMTHNKEGVLQDAAWIWEKKDKADFQNIITSEFAYAGYLLGYEEEAIRLFDVMLTKEYDEKGSALFFFIVHHLIKNNDEKAHQFFDQYLSHSLYSRNLSELKNAIQCFRPDKEEWIKTLDEKILSMEKNNVELVMNELTTYLNRHPSTGLLQWQALSLTFFRLSIVLRQWDQALKTCYGFQNIESGMVDKFFIWNKLYSALKVAVLNQWINPESSKDAEQVEELIKESPHNTISALGDLFAYLSAAKSKKEEKIAASFKQKAMEIYSASGIADVGAQYAKAIKEYTALFPDTKEFLQNAIETETPQHFHCPSCNAEIMNQSQKFCFVCGTELHRSK